MNEFALIKKYFAPLAKGFAGSLNLLDDAAVIDIPPGRELVVTADAINAGVHFLGNEDPALIAKKLLRVNLSDLAAMGATPLCYVICGMLPESTKESWIKRFAQGLREDQTKFSLHLAGGDTTATRGPLSLSLTALGTVAKGAALKRSSAKAGDEIYVSGMLGNGAFGLKSLQKKIKKNKLFEQHYLLPEPRLALGQKLHGVAHACMDISDGLLQDLGHICNASGVGAMIHRGSIPISSSAKAILAANKKLWDAVLAGGDDYELLFTAPRAKKERVAALAETLGLKLTCIGSISKGSGVAILDEKGKPLAIRHRGFRHFS